MPTALNTGSIPEKSVLLPLTFDSQIPIAKGLSILPMPLALERSAILGGLEMVLISVLLRENQVLARPGLEIAAGHRAVVQ